MNLYRISLSLDSAFGTPLVGDTLFGQICWGIRQRFGADTLNKLLENYTDNAPFLVVSDAFPAGYLPLPTAPSILWNASGETDRKVLKKKKWVAREDLKNVPFGDWQRYAKADKDLKNFGITHALQPHNTINRETGSTTAEAFAPYMKRQTWYGKKVDGSLDSCSVEMDLYVALDTTRFNLDDLKLVLSDIGMFGYGRDASTGLGKFSLTTDFQLCQEMHQTHANAFLTLANCSPVDNDFSVEKSFYQLTTRFGRHGADYALGGKPFKKPIILAKAGALFTPTTFSERIIVGNGLANVSDFAKETVHQGYAPVIAVCVSFDALL